jgi:hypothetical protein
MARIRSILLAGAVALAAAVLAPPAMSCSHGYSYAGYYSAGTASGVAATLSMLQEPSVPAGHVAAWVGVGGPGLGPNGTDEWLQVGLASFPGSTEGHLYYELTQPGRAPQYTELAAGIRPGERLRVAVLELPFARDTWVVVSKAGIVGPFYLPRSHRAWQPVATAESWDAGGAQCNRFSYRFGGVQLARGNGSWSPLRHVVKLQDPGRRVRREAPSSFSAGAD